MIKKFLGNYIGVQLEQRGLNDDHVCVRILSEDDGRWYPLKGKFSSGWCFKKK